MFSLCDARQPSYSVQQGEMEAGISVFLSESRISEPKAENMRMEKKRLVKGTWCAGVQMQRSCRAPSARHTHSSCPDGEGIAAL